MIANAHFLRAVGVFVLGIAASLCLHSGLAQATSTFTADGLFTTDLLSYGLAVSNNGMSVNGVQLNLPLNAVAPELAALAADGKTFDATLIDSTPTEIYTFDFNQAMVSSFHYSISGLPQASALVNFATYTVAMQPVRATAPEIDPTSAVSGVFMLMGLLAVMRGRRSGVPELR